MSSTKWICPICTAEYSTEADRNACWNGHCSDPASHETD